MRNVKTEYETNWTIGNDIEVLTTKMKSTKAFIKPTWKYSGFKSVTFYEEC